MHPELGFDVHRTAKSVAETLEDMGYRVTRGVGKTGVVGEMGSGKPVVAVRADMDALPIQEQEGRDYVSKIPGRMHACGHDAHIAMALGAALLLKDESFPGRIRLFFQPSEEVGDSEGKSGAQRMVEDGCMTDVDYIIGQHVDPNIDTGTIAITSGPVSGGVDSWFGSIHGIGGHGASPQKTIDPIYLSAHVIFALNAIISRRLDPFAPAVVSIGSINGGQTENVIPETVKMTGTLRFTDPSVQEQIQKEIRHAFAIVDSLGGKQELKFEIGSPPMINDENVSQIISRVGTDILGSDHVIKPDNTLGAEDFGSFLEHAPGAMFNLGTRIKDDEERTLHHPRFDINEQALPIGTAILIETALRLLKRN